jgi:hypothetical protein
MKVDAPGLPSSVGIWGARQVTHVKVDDMQGYQSQKEQMFHSGYLLHPGYSVAGAVDYEEILVLHGCQIQCAAQRVVEIQHWIMWM